MNTGNVFGIAVSALSAYSTRLNVTANNVANLNTEGFKPSEATMSPVSGGGVSTTVRQLDIPEVDIAKEMIDLISSEHGFKANLKTIQTQYEIFRSILDIKA